ncbi:MAG: FecR family protein [Planctomycetota bacterium]
MTTDQLNRLSRCIDAVCDDRATAADVAEIERLVGEDPEAVERYLDQVGVHTGVDWLVTSQQPAAPPLPDHSFASRMLAGRMLAHRASGGRLALYGLLSLGACVALMLSLPSRLDETPALVTPCAAIVSHSECAQWVVLHNAERPDGMRQQLFSTETLHLTEGRVAMRFADGAEVDLTGPAVLQVLAPDRALAVRGRLTASVDEDAVGFAIDTPRAQVVDLGTRFGLEVDDRGATDVVVFEGEVDVTYGPATSADADWSRRVMRMGEGMHVDRAGDAQRIVSIRSERFAPGAEGGASERPPLISEVRDNIRGAESWNYYEIVRRGMGEDAVAYVDREEHQWNGLEAGGMPAYLVGGDYVKMFNHDKVAADFAMELEVAQPVSLYVLFDKRVPPPEWLTTDFEATGDEIGLDIGPFLNLGGTMNLDHSAGSGPGVSVDDVLTVWKRVIPHPAIVRLGATETQTKELNMYAIVATPLDD